MADMNFTVVVVVDREHLAELELTLPTWRRYKPELWRVPWLVLYDRHSLDDIEVNRWFSKLATIFKGLVAWPPAGIQFDSHATKMTSALFYACRFVTTPWLLLLDVDAVATKRSDWIPTPRERTVMVGHASGSKIATHLEKLDVWAEGLPEFDKHPRCEFFARYPKLHGHCTFYRTEWMRRMVDIAEHHCGPFGVPDLLAEDAYFQFCAHRFRNTYQWMVASKTGWLHPKRGRSLESMVNKEAT